jgi:4-hydroxybenzoate polyprenyltransferase
VFALPFALTGALLALHHAQDWNPQYVTWRGLWIVVAMIAARSAAMGFNRLADARHDALNPRTAMRELPRGAMTAREAATFVAVSSIVFVFAAWKLGTLCFVLSPVALAIVFWYSLAKRFTSYTQLFLGLAMAVAPVGGWLAAGGRGGWEPWLLGLAIGTWVGGFDVLYACQDLAFDRAHGLRSIPVRFGVGRSLLISRGMHVITVVCLAALGPIADLGWVYDAGVAGVAVLLVYEQSLVTEDDLSQVKRAFDLNGYVGILYLVSTAAAIYVH